MRSSKVSATLAVAAAVPTTPARRERRVVVVCCGLLWFVVVCCGLLKTDTAQLMLNYLKSDSAANF